MAFCCKAATQAQWHNERNVPIYARAECVPTRSGRRGFPFKGERRYGRDALSNTSCECVVAKANEADCLANAEVQTREEGGGKVLILMYAPFTHVEEENFTEFVKFVKNEKTPRFF